MLELTPKQFDEELLKIPLRPNNGGFLSIDLANKEAGRPLVVSESLPPTERYLRAGVTIALIKAAQHFVEQAVSLEIVSAYRSLELQKSRFQARVQEIRRLHGDIAQESALELANTFTAGIPILAAHTAGAAVDVRLLNNEGVSLDFGTAYREASILSYTNAVDLEPQYRENRQRLDEGMAKQGFANYPFEWWHFSLGDVCWAYLQKKPAAIYEPIDFDPITQTTRTIKADTRAYFDIQND